MSKAKAGSIYQRKKDLANGETVTLPTWWIQYRNDGNTYRESSKSTKYEDADRLLKRRQGEIVTGKFVGLAPERVTFAELSQEILDDYIENERASLDHVKRRLTLHLLPALGKLRAAEFSTAHLKRYKEDRKKAKASNATINRELAIVKRIFKLALQADPPKIARMPYISMLLENNVRTEFLEHADYLRFREALPEPIRPLLVVAYYTGARSGELKRLKWTQVNLDALVITLDPGTTNNREGRTLPIYGEMIEWLKIERAIRDQNYPDCPWVFRRGGKPIKNFRKSWAQAAKAAGLENLVPHDLRRSAVREMSRAGIPEKIIMQVIGHKTRSIFDRYNIVNQNDLDVFRGRMEAREATRNVVKAAAAPRSFSILFSTPAVSEEKQGKEEERLSHLN